MTELQAGRSTPLIDRVGLFVSLLAGVVVFLPFASNTSPLDAVTLRVPGNQGNWWHALVGAPFCLAGPMIWIRLRSLANKQTFSLVQRRLVWIVVVLSICATISVETPFLLHLAGTSEWQRLAILGLSFGIVIASGATLWLRRCSIPPTRACLVGLSTAYLANAAVCLVVYGNAEGSATSKVGWLITMVLVWPMALEVVWVLGRSLKTYAALLLSGQ